MDRLLSLPVVYQKMTEWLQLFNLLDKVVIVTHSACNKRLFTLFGDLVPPNAIATVSGLVYTNYG
ncbi:hypothetical protein VSF3289_00578 [Vibrio scophthalmi]|uniref:Uncharacterized protein n=1 Tax=Vibrio scophthalmi TaxID=45658 RepID=A0A1E3WKM6_9VIBR|nr:hypothetical protein VSF3289_00578 [Vibrio scophthalmi]